MREGPLTSAGRGSSPLDMQWNITLKPMNLSPVFIKPVSYYMLKSGNNCVFIWLWQETRRGSGTAVTFSWRGAGGNIFTTPCRGETWWFAPRCLWCSALERLFRPFLRGSYFNQYLRVERPPSSSRIAINRSGWATAPPSAPVLCGEISQDLC